MKKIAPIVITLLVSLYMSGYMGVMFFASSQESGILRIFLGLIGLLMVGLVCAMIYTLVVRLREIDKEDKDDLSKY